MAIFNFFKRKKRIDKGYTDYIDLGKFGPSEKQQLDQAQNQAQTPDSETDFLSNLASATQSTNVQGADTSRLLDKISDLLERVDLIEHKISRIERRIGII